jgi:hypothetical protein
MKVLVIESLAGCADQHVAALEAAGSNATRCFPETWKSGKRINPYVCVGLSEGVCPLDDGVDVALVVRPHGSARLTGREAGATCAFRAGIPVAEDGAEDFDPYEQWIDARVGTNVVAACERAIERHFDGLRSEIRYRIDAVMRDAGLDPSALSFSFDVIGRDLHVTIRGPEVPSEIEQRLAVRAAEAIRAGKRAFSKKNTSYEIVAPTAVSSSA